MISYEKGGETYISDMGMYAEVSPTGVQATPVYRDVTQAERIRIAEAQRKGSFEYLGDKRIRVWSKRSRKIWEAEKAAAKKVWETGKRNNGKKL